MKSRITSLIMVAAIAVLMLVAGNTVAWAQACPTTPYYSPDFTSHQTCLTLNGNASFPSPAGSPAAITSWSGSGSTVTFQATNSFTAGELIVLSGFTTSTFFNGLTFPVLKAGLSGTQFEIAFSGFSGTTDTGTATPLDVLQLTPNQTHQVGSAWYNTQQPVAAAFSTTFTFQLSNSSLLPADGIAFVIQNSASSALGPDGCGIGFGFSSSGCTTGLGIPDSLAVEFNTYLNLGVDRSNNSVSVQSNGTNNNCVDSSCTLPGGLNYNLPVTLADGNIHTATVSYTLQSAPAQTSCTVGGAPGPCLDVILDGNDLFPLGVPVNLSTLLTLNSGNAWVGFTGSTGAQYTKQVIPSWTFTPQAQSQSGTVTTTTPTVFNANGGFLPVYSSSSGYDYTAQLTSGSSTTVLVTEIPFASQDDCNAILSAPDSGFQGAQCFVIQNGAGTTNAAVGFEVTCPGSVTDGTCGSNADPNFFATLGSDFYFNVGPTEPNDNPGLTWDGTPGDPLQYSGGSPLVGLLKFVGPDPLHPCTLNPGNNPPVILSNQVSSFNFIDGGTGAKPVKGGSSGTGSCWLPTYNTPGEAPPLPVITAPVNNQNYPKGPSVNASYTCAAVNNGSAATGPYLTVASCNAIDSPGGPVASGSPFDTTTPGPHTFTATVTDSATNTNSSTVTYNVQENSSTMVTSSANPSSYGQSVTFTATVTGAVTPTGSVTWAGIPGCTTTNLSSGVAMCSTSNFAVGGPYTVTASYSGDNYNSASMGSLSQSAIQATASITVTPYSVTYDGNPHTATGTATGVGGVNLSAGLTLSGTTHTSAGTYATDAWSFHDASGNYADASGTVSDLIKQATASITVTPYSVTYDGNPHTATGTATGAGSVDLSAGLTLSGTTHTSAGTYATDAWSFHDASGNYADASGTVSDLIKQAAASITVTPYSVTYDGNPHTATGTATGVGGVNLSAGLTLSGTTHTSAGTYATDAWSFHDASGNYADASGTVSDLIKQAAQTIAFGPLSNQVFGAAPFAVSATASSGLPVSFSSLTTGVCTVSGNTVTLVAVGTCTIQATQGGNTNYAAATSVNQSFQVIPPPTVTISPASWSFGTLYLGQSARQTFTLTNPGSTSVTISSITIPGNRVENPQPSGDPDDFQITANNCSKTLAAGASCNVTVTFVSDSDDPGLPNGDYASLTITDNGAGSPQAAYMSGAVINPKVSLSPTGLSFGKQTTNTTSTAKKVTLTNSGTTKLQLTGLAISPANFTLATGTTCTGSTTLSPGGTCAIYVTFTPTMKGTTYSGSVTITDLTLSATQSISLSGTGN